MSVAGDGDSSQPCPSSSSSFTSNLQFFVRTSSRTLSLHASPDETIQSIIFRVSAITRIPMCWLHLHYGKRHLPIDWTLSRCGIENDTTLQLVYCIEIRRICLPWKVVNDLIIIMNDLLAARSQISSGKEAQIYDIIDTLINKFVHMTPIGDNNDTICHLQVFFYSGVHVALCKLYHSPLILHQNVADYVVRLFLKYNLRKLPKFYHVHFVPVLLKFCKLFTRVNGKRDSLYLHCRKTLGFLVDSNGWRVFRKLKRINIITELYPFVVELADQIILSLSSESMPLTITDVAEFSCFLKALRSEIKEVGRPYPIPKEMHVEKWITSLYETFIKLLKKLDESLQKIENFMTQNADMQAESQLRQWANILTVLSDCRKLGKLYEDGSELLNALLLCRRAPLNALIRHAPRNDKYHWLHKHKYVTDFETRRNLVMMLFPEETKEVIGSAVVRTDEREMPGLKLAAGSIRRSTRSCFQQGTEEGSLRLAQSGGRLARASNRELRLRCVRNRRGGKEWRAAGSRSGCSTSACSRADDGKAIEPVGQASRGVAACIQEFG